MYENCTISSTLYKEPTTSVAKPTPLAYFYVVSGERVMLDIEIENVY